MLLFLSGALTCYLHVEGQTFTRCLSNYLYRLLEYFLMGGGLVQNNATGGSTICNDVPLQKKMVHCHTWVGHRLDVEIFSHNLLFLW